MTSEVANLWFYPSSSESKRLVRLFCFPYAGGSTIIFRDWPALMPKTIEVCPVELPGRGRRMLEAPFREMESLVESLVSSFCDHVYEPFALFGHSMGASICFALAHRLQELGKSVPVHLFLSGRRGPRTRVDEVTYNLPETEFVRELRELGGTPGEVLDNPEALELLVPLLRADFQLIQTWICDFRRPLSCPITVFGGLEDRNVLLDDLWAWQRETSGEFTVRLFNGDHFFVRRPESLVKSIATDLNFTLSGQNADMRRENRL